MHRRLALPACLTGLLCVSAVQAQQQSADTILQSIDKDGCALLQPSGAKVCRYDYQVDGRTVEAFLFQPVGDGPFTRERCQDLRYRRGVMRSMIRRVERLEELIGCGSEQGPPTFIQVNYVEPNGEVTHSHMVEISPPTLWARASRHRRVGPIQPRLKR